MDTISGAPSWNLPRSNHPIGNTPIYSLIQTLAKGFTFLDAGLNNQTHTFQQKLREEWLPGQCIETMTEDVSGAYRYRIYDGTLPGVVIEVLDNNDQIVQQDKVADTNLLTCWNNLTGNDPDAQFSLGTKYVRRFGWENTDEVYSLFSSAAKQGHVLAECYQTLVDMKRCTKHFGNNFELGEWITFDSHEVTSYVRPDLRHCTYTDIHQCAADIRSLSTHCELAKYIDAHILLNKCGAERWHSLAQPEFKQIMKNGAMKDCRPAQYQYAQLLHESGDENAARYWLEQAAEDYAPAQWQLSEQYPSEAYHGYREAAFRQGDPRAVRAITIEANNTFRFYAINGKLWAQNSNTDIHLPVLSKELATKICSYNAPRSMKTPATWLDAMLELIRWDSSTSAMP
jgi:hypothetical protein